MNAAANTTNTPNATETAATIRASGLSKRFGDVIAVDSISFDVAAGECFGMLGPNGAGKTTTMRMIGCMTPISEGELSVLGLDTRTCDRAIKAQLGVVPQENNLDDELTVQENLVIYAGYFGIGRTAAQHRSSELLEFMSLGDRASARVRELSGGMKRRLVLARALVNEPQLLLLDEPTTGLDPQARHHIWERLDELAAGGTTLVLTTHYMEEAARLCDRLVIMNEARILREGKPHDLIRAEIPRHVVEIPRRVGLRINDIERLSDDVQELSDRFVVHTNDSAAVMRGLAARGVDETMVIERMASLEDVFLRLTGRVIEN